MAALLKTFAQNANVINDTVYKLKSAITDLSG